MGADLDDGGADADAGDHLAGDAAGRDPAGGLTGGGAAAAAVVTNAVLGLIGEIGVPGAMLPGDIAVVLRTGIHVVDHQADGRAGG
jgi:hypothetical protein